MKQTNKFDKFFQFLNFILAFTCCCFIFIEPLVKFNVVIQTDIEEIFESLFLMVKITSTLMFITIFQPIRKDLNVSEESGSSNILVENRRGSGLVGNDENSEVYLRLSRFTDPESQRTKTNYEIIEKNNKNKKFKLLIFKIQFFVIVPVFVIASILYFLQRDIALVIERISKYFLILLSDITFLSELKERVFFILLVEMNLCCLVNTVYMMPEVFNFDAM